MANIADIEKPKRRLGLRIALILIPIVLIPFVIAAGVAFFHARSILREQANEYLVSVTQGQSAVIHAWLDQREQQVLLNAQSQALQQALEALLRFPATEEEETQLEHVLTEVLTDRGSLLFSEAMIVSGEGNQILLSTNPNHVGQSLDSYTAQEFSSHGTAALQSAADFNIEGLGFLSYAAIEPQRAGSEATYLVGISAKPQIEQLLKSLQMLSERRKGERLVRGKSLIAIEPDTILSLAPYAITYKVRTDPRHPVFATADTLEPGSLAYIDPDGSQVLGAYKHLPNWDLTVMVELPQAEVFAGITDIAPYGAAIILGSVFLIAIIVLLITNAMLRPLGQLSTFALQVARGDWNRRLPENRKDEIGTLSLALNRMAQEIGSLYQNLEAQVQARTEQIRIASEVARSATAAPNLEAVLRQAVTLIQERFGYDHVSLYLLDSQAQKAILQDAAGPHAGAQKQRNDPIAVGGATMIGWVTARNQPLLWPQTQASDMRIQANLLPGASSEACVPLQIAERVLGVLDVQSDQPQAFHQDDLQVLQTLADQLSAAIDNARLAQVSVTAAERARLVSEITSELSMLMEPEEVLRTAAQELHRALPEAEVIVQLAPADERSSESSSPAAKSESANQNLEGS